MRASSKIAFAALCAASLFAGGCTAFTTDIAECESASQCRDQFGLGYVCNSDGLCAKSEPLSRCAFTYPEDLFDNPAYGDRIVVGNLMDRSIATQRARELSARLGLLQANAQGGLEGQNFGLVMCTIEESSEYDALSRTEAAVASARYLVDGVGVVAIIGPASSSDTQATFLEIQDSGVLVISPSATSPALTQLDPATVSDETPGLLWRTVPPDSFQGAAIAADMRDPGAGRARVTNVAAIYADGAYGGGLYTEFARRFTDAGGTVVPYPFSDSTQRDAAITTVATTPVEEVLFISSQPDDIIAFLDTAATLAGYDGKNLFLTDAAANADVLTGVGDTSRFAQVRGSRPAPLDESEDLVYAGFIAAYQAEYGEDVRPYSFTANAYDAAWLVAYGAAWALYQGGDIRGQAIARGLRKLSSGTAVEIIPTSWNQVKQSFAAGQSVDVAGASGNLDYSPMTEETSAPISIWEIRQGEIVGVDRFDPVDP